MYDTTGITATAGIAPNLYLCKIAMDIVAKHIQADSKGVRIAELSVNDYRKCYGVIHLLLTSGGLDQEYQDSLKTWDKDYGGYCENVP